MTNNTTTKKTYHIGNPNAHDAKASKTTGKSLDEVYQFLKPFFEKRK